VVDGNGLENRRAGNGTVFTGVFIWRRERDSNPRWNLRPTNDLANHPLQPLGYLSGWFMRQTYGLAHRAGKTEYILSGCSFPFAMRKSSASIGLARAIVLHVISVGEASCAKRSPR
jgi:hypothetical protein